MHTRSIVAVCVAACLGIGASVVAQEGHPLSGTWSGDYGAGAQRTHVTVVMNWDGKNVTGIINPGPDAIPIANVALDLTNWTVHLEADAKSGSATPVHIVADGQIEDLGSYHRRIVGTWSQGATKGDLKLTRD
jgi:hypothetical protein